MKKGQHKPGHPWRTFDPAKVEYEKRQRIEGIGPAGQIVSARPTHIKNRNTRTGNAN